MKKEFENYKNDFDDNISQQESKEKNFLVNILAAIIGFFLAGLF